MTTLNVRESPQYLKHSLRRLRVFADRPLRTKEDVAAALIEWRHVFMPEQLTVLANYVKGK